MKTELEETMTAEEIKSFLWDNSNYDVFFRYSNRPVFIDTGDALNCLDHLPNNLEFKVTWVKVSIIIKYIVD